MQADLRLCWSHIPLCWKSHVAAQSCAHALLNLLNKLGKSDKKSDTLKLFCQHIFGVKTSTFCQYARHCYERYFIMLPKSVNH